ncbi:hypothetical protein J5690_08210 [bacterium]|nr:hypothetical protein [bacterium]
MSHYETPEQRSIRILTNQVTSLNNQNNWQSARIAEIQAAEECLRKENDNLREQMKKQAEASKIEQKNMSERLIELDKQTKERERLQNEKIKVMEKEHGKKLKILKEGFDKEQEGIKKEIKNVRSEMLSNLKKIRSDTEEKLKQQKEESERNLAKTASELENKINDVDRKVTNIESRISEKERGDKELAEYWMREAARMKEYLNNTPHPQLLDNDLMRNVERNIDLAQGDIRGGQYQVAITVGRSAFFTALDMKDKLAEAELEWNYWFNAVKSREIQLLKDLESAESRKYSFKTKISDGKEEKEVEISFDQGMNYWTCNHFDIAKDQINSARQLLEKIDEKTLDELKCAEKQLHAAHEQLALLENVAVNNVAMSLSRFETAKKIGSVLGKEYRMLDQDGDYFDEKFREEYHAVFENDLTQEKVAVVIKPIPDKSTGIVTNHIDLLVDTPDNNQEKKVEMRKSVVDALRDSGVRCFPCSERFGTNTAREIDRVGNIDDVRKGEEKCRGTLPQGLN